MTKTLATWKTGEPSDIGHSGRGIFNILGDHLEIRFASFADFNYLNTLIMNRIEEAKQEGREEIARLVSNHVHP